MEQCEPLLRLQQRLAAAHARMDAVRPLLPPGLVPFVKPGPVDENSWTLLATGPAVAAKLRQLQPRLQEMKNNLRNKRYASCVPLWRTP